MASNDSERRDEVDSAEAAAGDDEDTGAQIAPIIKLEEVAVTTGEEDEDALLDLKAKLYRFDKEQNLWKERGTGSIKLLKHKETGRVRIVMRQAKTLKICANHNIFPGIKLTEHAGNEKSCVWHAPDFADGELKEEMFAIRFGSIEKGTLSKEYMGLSLLNRNPHHRHVSPSEASAYNMIATRTSSQDTLINIEHPNNIGKGHPPLQKQLRTK